MKNKIKSTFVVPVSIGSPPTTYPLQLDLASSDILLASTLCGSHCPTSLGTTTNPYYDVSKPSAGFESINSNQTVWNTSSFQIFLLSPSSLSPVLNLFWNRDRDRFHSVTQPPPQLRPLPIPYPPAALPPHPTQSHAPPDLSFPLLENF